MKVLQLKEILTMFGDETEVFIQTTPHDLCQPITKKAISLIGASIDSRSGCLNKEKVLLTAYFPHEATQ